MTSMELVLLSLMVSGFVFWLVREYRMEKKFAQAYEYFRTSICEFRASHTQCHRDIKYLRILTNDVLSLLDKQVDKLCADVNITRCELTNIHNEFSIQRNLLREDLAVPDAEKKSSNKSTRAKSKGK